LQKRRLATLTTLLFFSLLVLAPAAQANSSKVLLFHGTGTWTWTGWEILEYEAYYDNEGTLDKEIMTVISTFELHGILEGTWIAVQKLVIEYDTGTQWGEGLEGSHLIGTVGEGVFEGEPYFVDVEDEHIVDLDTFWSEGTFEILGGNVGDKENIEGYGRYWGPGITGGYEVWVYWDVD
jgi:hypothetical protein